MKRLLAILVLMAAPALSAQYGLFYDDASNNVITAPSGATNIIIANPGGLDSTTPYVKTNTGNANFGGLRATNAANGIASNDLATIGQVRELLDYGGVENVTSNMATYSGDTNSYLFNSAAPAIQGSRVYTGLTNMMYVGTCITTGTFTQVSGPMVVHSYIGMSGGSANRSLTVRPEIYYTYSTNTTEMLGDWDGPTESVADGTNLYSGAISFTPPSLTGTVYILRRWRIVDVQGTPNKPNFQITFGSNTASHISFPHPAAGSSVDLTSYLQTNDARVAQLPGLTQITNITMTSTSTMIRAVGNAPNAFSVSTGTGGSETNAFAVNTLGAYPVATSRMGYRFGTGGSTSPWLFPYSGFTYSSPNAAGLGLGFWSYDTGENNIGVAFTGDDVYLNGKSGTYANAQFVRTFMPSSGSATFKLMYLYPKIGQTGTASGKTWGLLIALNSVSTPVNFVSLEANGGNVILCNPNDYSTATNRVGIGTNNPSQLLDVAGNAIIRSSLQVNGDALLLGKLYGYREASATTATNYILGSQDMNVFATATITATVPNCATLTGQVWNVYNTMASGLIYVQPSGTTWTNQLMGSNALYAIEALGSRTMVVQTNGSLWFR